ncbi:MAG: glycosyl hydrolase family 18 protein [Lentisphaerota bacterium]
MKKLLAIIIGLVVSFSSYSYIVTEYFGIFNDGWNETKGKEDNFNKCIALNPPYNSWDLTFICFLVVKEKNGVYEAKYENMRGYDDPYPGTQIKPILPAKGDSDKDRIQKLKKAALAKNPNMKFLVSLGYGSVGNLSFLAGAAKTPAAFAQSVGQVVEDCGLDGFDIDYEGVNVNGQGIAQGISKIDFINIIIALRTELDNRGTKLNKKLYLTLTPDTLNYIDAGTVNKFVDFLQMQSYDYSGDLGLLPQAVLDLGIDKSKILFGRDIENGDTLTSGNKSGNVGDIPDYVQENAMRGIMGWRVNSGKEMGNGFTEVIQLGNSLQRTSLK